ncbi:LapD/MoxY N-terminal periplasmic domain-containing protein [Sulfuricurvum sp.]|uniref:bifunctional diguanylate cyclase/phosphodiesterase n=1 Tax=Sulfuricurvum sp. TaxID=2025608 RepID=UPI00262C7217|nr:LapD/MoxY N-terminal periplasmic domain-containing protein [Sulfuricurvum sp.]MDD2780627.1 LapD/MoxY N-terminal periplasmic domain-containing protein [Sulfuricurvum sp.]
MSLFKQLVIMLTLFLGVILISVMLLNFKSATEFVQNQLYSDAKNTAHSLGLSLSKVADPKDASSMETMINAIYDSGYYQRIRLVDIDDEEVYTRESDVRVSDVPQWFIEMVPINNASATSDIMIGWNRFGTLEVSGHTGNAYRQLYSTFIDLVQTFLMIGIIVFATLYFLLSLSLKSLKRIRDQAKAIIDNEFIIEKKIPFTTEFRSVTTAMNAMVAKVKDIFERENETLRRYHELLYKDTETKLHNRRYLTAKLPDYLQSDASLSSGIYLLISLDEIDRLKREKGYERYTQIINTLADELNTQLGSFRHTLIARLNESDFFAAIPACEIEPVSHQIEIIMTHMREMIEKMDKELLNYLIIGCGVGIYSENDTLKTLFSRADHAVIQAKLRGNFSIDLNHESNEALVLGREEWRSELLKSLDESRMLLAFQSVVEQRGDNLNVIHEEIFLRLLDREGIIHSAGYFIPVATSLGLIDTLDRYMIEKVFKHIKEHNPITPLALNLSGDFVKKYSNIQWLRAQLETFHRQNDLVLWFEVSNTTALHELEAVSAISALVKMFGYRFGIDHFTIPEAGAHYLQAIRPDYVKANSAYLQDMMFDHDTGKSRESFNNLIRSLGISIVAINIEEAKEVENLKILGIECFQGSHIAPVALLQ